MKAKRIMAAALISLAGMLFGAGPSFSAETGSLQFTCSAQVFEAFGPEVVAAFEEKTGIPVDLYVSGSHTAIKRVENDYADLAASTVRLYPRHREYGYYEIVFAKDPMVLFTNKYNDFKPLSKADIRKIFRGEINNWKALGGADQAIVSIIPEKQTGAYQSFRSMLMDGEDVHYDFMAYRSTMVVEAAKRFPYVISFITRAAVANEPEIRVLSVDRVSPADPEYPYFVTFSFVTKGKPAGASQKFIDFVTNGAGKQMLQKKGLILLKGD